LLFYHTYIYILQNIRNEVLGASGCEKVDTYLGGGRAVKNTLFSLQIYVRKYN
jgi:hypothetical protein